MRAVLALALLAAIGLVSGHDRLYGGTPEPGTGRTAPMASMRTGQSDEPLPEGEPASGVFVLDDEVAFNVLDEVVFDQDTGQLSLVGHFDDRFFGRTIPYLQHLAEFLDNPSPEFTLNGTPESDRAVDGLMANDLKLQAQEATANRAEKLLAAEKAEDEHVVAGKDKLGRVFIAVLPDWFASTVSLGPTEEARLLGEEVKGAGDQRESFKQRVLSYKEKLAKADVFEAVETVGTDLAKWLGELKQTPGTLGAKVKQPAKFLQNRLEKLGESATALVDEYRERGKIRQALRNIDGMPVEEVKKLNSDLREKRGELMKERDRLLKELGF